MTRPPTVCLTSRYESGIMNRERPIRSRARQFAVRPSRGWTLPNGSFALRRVNTPQRTGFTLVEMLVAVTLVLLMMVMFGEMFQLASGSVTKQRVMADNDQNARTFVTVIRADFDKRSFRSLVPFFAGELSTNPGTPFGLRRGYFSISNNSLPDGLDDVLQFTVDSAIQLRNADESPYFGRAIPLFNPTLGAVSSTVNFLRTPNQPDRDDGQAIANEAGSSKAAEIAYFMRGGRLYRRAMLLRFPTGDINTSDPYQPSYRNSGSGANVDFFAPGGVYDSLPNENFWRDFDFSAHRTPGSLVAYAPTLPINARFHGVGLNDVDYLANDRAQLPYGIHPFQHSLGQTWNRFGHNHEVALGPPFGPLATALTNGAPREFTNTTATAQFVGRFSHEETSNARFQYPQALAVAPTTPPPPGVWNGNPMDAVGTELSLNPISGAVQEFLPNDALTRTGVDLLLSHVHEFRIEVWDQRLGDFAPVGHNRTIGGIPGDFNVARRLNATCGPLPLATTGVANVFDTWHPLFNRNANFNPATTPPTPVLGDEPDRPSYRPLNYDPSSGLPGAYPAVGAGPPPPGPTPFWTPNTPYAVGDVVFPRREDLNGNGVLDPGEDGSNGFTGGDGLLQENVRIGTEDVNYNGVLDAGEDTNGNTVLDLGAPPGLLTEDLNWNGVLDVGEDGVWGFPVDGAINTVSLRDPVFPSGLTFAYRCIRNGTSGATRLDEPNQGRWSTTPGQVLRDPSGNGPDWIVEYNVRPLRAIRITVRFEHPTSKQMKQVTIVHSLRDTTAVP